MSTSARSRKHRALVSRKRRIVLLPLRHRPHERLFAEEGVAELPDRQMIDVRACSFTSQHARKKAYLVEVPQRPPRGEVRGDEGGELAQEARARLRFAERGEAREIAVPGRL